jgi:hypothetical protein
MIDQWLMPVPQSLSHLQSHPNNLRLHAETAKGEIAIMQSLKGR